MTPPRMISQVLVWWLAGNILFVSVWDIVLLAFGQETATVSYFLYDTMNRHPRLWFFVGIAVGHLIVPLTIAAANGRGR